ncbi:hypothetical protein [Actinomadura chokoriensis]|uniref:hypothetical protein n=1 Tax=Actinomadura chokoriensis TaxID=454156 RepID=UPI0031F9E0AE
MDELDRSGRRQFFADDPAAGIAEVLPGTEADPRVQAAVQAPQSAADIVAQHSSATVHHVGPGQTDATFGSGPLTGSAKWPGGANPLTGQSPLEVTETPSTDDDAGGTGPTDETGVHAPQTPSRRNNRPALGRQERQAGQDPSSPPGDAKSKAGEFGLRKVGQGANMALRTYSDRYAPGLYDGVNNSKVGDSGLSKLEGSRLGRLLPGAFWDGFRDGRSNGGTGRQRNGGNGKRNSVGHSGKSASSRTKVKLLMAVALPVLIPAVCILMFLALLLGVSVSSDGQHTQPTEDSDALVAKYLPDGWQRLLKNAAHDAGAAGRADYAAVPWTVLAGITAAQTDFARYSPYDNIDRDPGRTSAAIPLGGEGGGNDAVVVGATGGAGPGPITGVTGAGSAASMGFGHPGPPSGDLSHQFGWFLYALRMHESGGDYTVGNAQGACGAYQYINSTWNNYMGYPTACEAPASVQDRRAVHDVKDKWNTYHKWQQVAAAHFYPAWARSPEKWDRCPAACHVNPTVWAYVDDVMKRMNEAARTHPQGSGGAGQGPGAAAQPALFRSGAPGTYADGCPVAGPTPAIGGKGAQGSGPYLLNPAAAGQMRMTGLDPQSPCDSSLFVARQLGKAAQKVHDEPDAPEWRPDGTAKDQENARKYWSEVIETSGIFVDRTADPDAPCAVPPPDDPEKPWSVSFKIISIWNCQATRSPELYLVTGGEYDSKDDRMRYTVETDRAAATHALVNEALSVSYGAGKWKTGKCDNAKDGRQGVFPMTEREARTAGVEDRCDVDENITGAARLVLSAEKVKPERRPHDRGPFQPMVGGWQKLGIAMGTDLGLFSIVGPGQRFSPDDTCTKVMTEFVTLIAPHATDFAELKDLPKRDALDEWASKLKKAEKANGIADPTAAPSCVVGSWAPGYNAALAQIAAGRAGSGAYTDNIAGLGNYYQAREIAIEATKPVAGRDTLVVPRLALRPLEEVGAPIASDATEAWSRLGTADGVTIPLSQVAAEYAWYFGGVISPFDSAGELIGSLSDSSAAMASVASVQVEVGPDGCPRNAPHNTLRDGAAAIGIRKLCIDSVARARTPEAAKAIKWALSRLGLGYSWALRNELNYADCSSFVSRAYRDSGAIPNLYPQGDNAPNTHDLREVPWTIKISRRQARPGDLVEPIPGHVAMQLVGDYVVHTNRTGDVSKVERRAYPTAYWTGWVDRSNA